jgi:heat shock protein HtpX
MVQTLSRQAGLPMPRVYIIPKEAPNAFATGRNPEHAVVAVTQGLLTLMNRQETMGVLAHELAHVKNRDILIGTIAATMAGAIMMLASMARWSAIFGGGHRDDNHGGGMGAIGMIAMSIIAPMAAMIIQMAVSRSREYMADATGAQHRRQPRGAGQGPGKAGGVCQADPHGCQPLDGPYVHRQSIVRKKSAEPVLHASTGGGADQPAAGRAVRQRWVGAATTAQGRRIGGRQRAGRFWDQLKGE